MLFNGVCNKCSYSLHRVETFEFNIGHNDDEITSLWYQTFMPKLMIIKTSKFPK